MTKKSYLKYYISLLNLYADLCNGRNTEIQKFISHELNIT